VLRALQKTCMPATERTLPQMFDSQNRAFTVARHSSVVRQGDWGYTTMGCVGRLCAGCRILVGHCALAVALLKGGPAE
jgi:hypothetical protein